MPNLKEIVDSLGDTVYSHKGTKLKGDVHTSPVSEFGHPEIFHRLSTTAKVDGITISFAGFVGFDWINYASPEEGGILCDINANQKPFWEAVFKLVLECNTPQKFNTRFSACEPVYDRKFGLRKLLKYDTPTYTEGMQSWMNNQDRYDIVRNLIQTGNIAAMTLDAMDTGRYQDLSSRLKSTRIENGGLKVGLIYLSNIPSFEHVNKSDGELARGVRFNFYGQPINSNAAEKLFGNQLLLCEPDTRIIIAEPFSPKKHRVASYVETDDCFASYGGAHYLVLHKPGQLQDKINKAGALR